MFLLQTHLNTCEFHLVPRSKLTWSNVKSCSPSSGESTVVDILSLWTVRQLRLLLDTSNEFNGLIRKKTLTLVPSFISSSSSSPLIIMVDDRLCSYLQKRSKDVFGCNNKYPGHRNEKIMTSGNPNWSFIWPAKRGVLEKSYFRLISSSCWLCRS